MAKQFSDPPSTEVVNAEEKAMNSKMNAPTSTSGITIRIPMCSASI